jgi:hypothetical protein
MNAASRVNSGGRKNILPLPGVKAKKESPTPGIEPGSPA